MPGQGQQRHGKQIKGVAQQGNGPITAGAIADVAKNQAQAQADEFPKAGYNPHHGGAGSQQGQVGAGDTAIGHRLRKKRFVK
jgi:hypothetical protein